MALVDFHWNNQTGYPWSDQPIKSGQSFASQWISVKVPYASVAAICFDYPQSSGPIQGLQRYDPESIRTIYGQCVENNMMTSQKCDWNIRVLTRQEKCQLIITWKGDSMSNTRTRLQCDIYCRVLLVADVQAVIADRTLVLQSSLQNLLRLEKQDRKVLQVLTLVVFGLLIAQLIQ